MVFSTRVFPMVIAAATSVAALAGCSSQGDLADRLDATSAQASQTADDYRRGGKLVREGNANIKAGRKLVRRGEDRVEEGNRQLREGEALQASARGAYCQQVNYQDSVCR